MSEVQSRPTQARGRGSARSGRGGFGRGARGGSRQANGDPTKDSVHIEASEDQGELGEMKKQHAVQLSTLKELFPDWNDIDLVFALQETDGDVQTTIERITEGNVSQFSEVPKKTKDRSRSKVKEPSKDSSENTNPSGRGGRGRGGFESTRGTRGRGRGGARGGRGGASATNGPRNTTSNTPATTGDTGAWDTTPGYQTGDSSWDQPSKADTDGDNQGQWGSVVASETTPATASEGQKSSLIPEELKKNSWARLFATPKPVPPPSKPVATGPSVPEIDQSTEVPAPVEESAVASVDEVPVAPPIIEEPVVEPPTVTDTASVDASLPDTASANITPSKDELTEDNLEHLPDTSNPAPAGTAASTVASSRDPRSAPGTATPLTAAQQQTQWAAGNPMGGFATNAFRATTQPTRSASFQKKILEQQEAVVMPGKHAIDRATVQFGSMGLNGDTDAAPLDVDEDREEAETRTQPPHPSPPSQPRASLPPAPRQPPPAAETPPEEPFGTPKQAPGLPPPPQQQSSQETMGAPGLSQQSSQIPSAYNQFGNRYGQPNAQETSAPAQKPYDPFGHQGLPPSQFDYPAHSQAPGQQRQQGLSGFTSGGSDMSSYYTADAQRGGYGNYYGSGLGQETPNQQDVGAGQQRAGSGFGAAQQSSGYPTSQAQQVIQPRYYGHQDADNEQTQTRYAEAQNSGQNTPNPAIGGQNAGSQIPQSQMHQQGHNQGQHGGFPYGHPYYNSPYYAAYMNQFQNGYGQQGYGGAPFGAKSGMYGQPHHGYGMNPQGGYESTSPANPSGFGQSGMHGRDSGLGSSLGGDFNSRTGSAPSQGQQHSAANSGFSGGMSDPFGRSQGTFQGQNPSSYGQQQGAGQQGTDDSLKGFGDSSKTGTGPSPSLSQQGRPGSTTNMSGQVQSGLPPQQSHQQGFGNYGSHLNSLGGNQGSGYGGLGGLGGHQAGQNHQAGGYNYGGGFGNYGGGYNRGGWGGNYGH
ncbi:MAG: hypothetical protein M1820_003169 [Bogoriella megaspora]|nr:MAG: hypothetical protein M1820_003169 [Bogoriella megaspora]